MLYFKYEDKSKTLNLIKGILQELALSFVSVDQKFVLRRTSPLGVVL